MLGLGERERERERTAYQCMPTVMESETLIFNISFESNQFQEFSDYVGDYT